MLTTWQLLAVVFAAGTLSILFNVANATMFVSIVPPERYVDGQSLIYGSRAMSFLLGPSLGGLLTEGPGGSPGLQAGEEPGARRSRAESLT